MAIKFTQLRAIAGDARGSSLAPAQRSKTPPFSAIAVLCIATITAWALAPTAHAALVQFSFTISGTNGETGSGRFVWDDAVVASGSPLANSLTDTGDVLSLDISLSGGNVVGGSTAFQLADCVGAFLEDTPNFATDVNFWCNNGTNSLSGRLEYTNYLNDTADMGAGTVQPVLGPSSSELTFTPGTSSRVSSGANVIPATPWWSLLLTAGLLVLVTARRTRR